MTHLRSLAFLAALVSASAAPAASDSQVWTTESLNVALSDRWRVSEDLTERFSDKRGGLYEIESATLLGFRIRPGVTVAAGYVHDPLYSHGNLTAMEHRAREQISFDNVAQLGKGKLSVRMRLEQRWRRGVDGTAWRARPYAKFAFPIAGKTMINLSNETFVNLDTTAFQGHTGIDRMRNLLSLSAPLTKHLTGEAGYMNQHGFVRGGPDTSDNIAYFAVTLGI